MDEEKRKELERLKSQINPEVLKRVAEAMGGPEAGAQAAATSGGGGAVAESRPAPSGSSAGLSDLKARIRRREKELDAEAKKKPEIKPTVFIIYASSHFRAKSLGGYIQRMGFTNVILLSEPAEFVKNLLNTLNDANVQKVAIAVYLETYGGLQALLSTPAMQAVGAKLPRLAKVPIFAIIDEEMDPAAVEGIDSSLVVSMQTSPEFNGKRVQKVLDQHT